jgi:hypothetical protein
MTTNATQHVPGSFYNDDEIRTFIDCWCPIPVRAYIARLAAGGAAANSSDIPADLFLRIEAAISRILRGESAMRAPADNTDPDLVLTECRDVLASLQRQIDSLRPDAAAQECECSQCRENRQRDHASPFYIEPLRGHDAGKPNTEQGLYRKYDVRRTDGSDAPGGKHHGCDYFVLDVSHDQAARAALAAYAGAIKATHPQLADDMCDRYDLRTSTPLSGSPQGEGDVAESSKPHPRWNAAKPGTRHPQTLDAWDWQQDDTDALDRSMRRLAVAGDYADPRAPDQMAVVLRIDLIRVLMEVIHRTAQSKVRAERIERLEAAAPRVVVPTAEQFNAFWTAHDYAKGGAFDRFKEAYAAMLAATPQAASGTGGGVDLGMARHWIDRYAAGIDDEPQMDLIAEAFGVELPASGHIAASVTEGKA